MPTLLSRLWCEEKHLRQALEAGGFAADKTKFFTKDAYLKISDLGRWSQLAGAT